MELNKMLCKIKNVSNIIFSINKASYSNFEFKQSTIYALSSGQGKCGVAVMRISGSEAKYALDKMTNISTPEPRKAYLRNIRNPKTNEIIDKGLCLWFPAPNSFTGENSVEFQVHGGSAILSSLMSALSELEFQAALPGEFTRRAFMNNKLDLTEIEGLADLIHAETEQQRKQALLQAQGNLSSLYNKWRKILLKCLANIEAYIDFGEEENIENDILMKTRNELRDLRKRMIQHLSDGRKGEILRSGIRTTILGEPNAGKSSLLNLLVQRNAAIVTNIPGTTRDIVEINANISGYPVMLADTAGLNNETSDIIEIEGIKRAHFAANNSDFIILVINGEEFMRSEKSYEDYLQSYIRGLGLDDLLLNKDKQLINNCLPIVNKVDKITNSTLEDLKKEKIPCISCTEGEGLNCILEILATEFSKIYGNPSVENPTISQQRHRNHVQLCLKHISNYLDYILEHNYDMVLAAQEIRSAARELGKITGRVYTEEVLDIIFKNFCIGK